MVNWPWRRASEAGTVPADEPVAETPTAQQAEAPATTPQATPESKSQSMNAPTVDVAEIENRAIEALQTCYDPEIPVNIYELGLIYDVRVAPTGDVHVVMTLTSPNCPAAAELPLEVETKMRSIPGVVNARVEITFDPPWEPSRMTEAARLQLGML
jgi:FeS assembly SUF system protein